LSGTKEKNIIAFTGSQIITDDDSKLIEQIISKLEKPNCFITGGCIGVDYFAAKMITKYFPDTEHVAILPYNLSKVPKDIYRYATQVVGLEKGTTYRDRNEAMVRNGSRLIAFWTGKKAYSGTFMTMNIASRENKLKYSDIYMIGKNLGLNAKDYYRDRALL
tara:strand:+ start:629 stop:1114 length:486 start_codon:yes stop_codon:yes gene_type:complete